MTPEQEAKCREAFDKWAVSPQIDACVSNQDWLTWQAAWSAAQAGRDEGWFLPKSRINDLQQASVVRAIKRCKQAHFVDLSIRINGAYEREEADWVKHLLPTPPTQPSEGGGE